MYKVDVNIEENRLFLQLKGFLKDDEVQKASEEVKRGIDSLKSNFDIINDISEFTPATQKGREIIKDAQIYALTKKVARVVRVTGNVIGKIQFERTSKEAGYTAVSVSSLEEAYKFLQGET